MRIIALEGVNASGKSSLANQICSSLKSRGQHCFAVDPSGIGTIGRSLRSAIVDPSFHLSPDLDAVLFTALRADGAREVLDLLQSEPEATIVLERWSLALAAYGSAEAVRSELISEMRKILDKTLSVDLTILLDIDGDLAHKRIAKMPVQNRFELKGQEYLNDVANWYRTFAKSESNTTIVDASGSPDVTFSRLKEIIM